MFGWVQALDAFFRQARLRYLGLGLLIAWVYGSWFSAGIFPDGSPRGPESLYASLIASAVVLLALAVRPHRRVPLPPAAVFAAAVVVSATTLLFFVMPSGLPLVAAGVVGGAASALLWVGWGELFCQVDLEITEACIPASLGVFVVAVLLTYLLPSPASGILAALFPVASALLLLLCKNDQPADFSFPAPVEPLRSVLPVLVSLAFCSMVCGTATGCVVTSLPPEGGRLLGEGGGILFYVVGGALAALIALFAIAHTSRMSFSFLYEWAIPLIVFSLALRALGDTAAGVLASLLACTAALCVEMLFFAIFARITAKGLCLPSETFGIFRAMVQLGFLLGAVLGGTFAARWGLPLYLGLICLCVVMLPLFTHLQKRFEVPGPLPGAFGDGETGDVRAVDGARADGAASEVPAGAAFDYVAAMTETFKLSPREQEVLRYLGKGRSVPYMREVMTLSKSTIETHIKHIYAKTDVHSKQELIDLIESYREPDDSASAQAV